MSSNEIVSVVCEDWKCSRAVATGCGSSCPNWDPHDLPLSDVPNVYHAFFRENGFVELS